MNKQISKIVLSIILVMAPIALMAAENSKTWVPKPNFSIENSTYLETLIFISGISYALSASNSELASINKQNFFCSPNAMLIDSKILIDIINEKHSGSITSEQAIDTITRGLKQRYPCALISYNKSLKSFASLTGTAFRGPLA